MFMDINLSNEIKLNMETASKEIGLSKEEIISRAITLYLASLKGYLSLKEEMYAWEEAGIEDINTWNEENLKNG